MNERLKELMLEAGYAAPEIAGRGQLLAELIVRECAGIVDNKIEVSRYVHEAELLRECSTTIKQHFGVEDGNV